MTLVSRRAGSGQVWPIRRVTIETSCYDMPHAARAYVPRQHGVDNFLRARTSRGFLQGLCDSVLIKELEDSIKRLRADWSRHYGTP
ncbi:hypothetical protein PUNSTDRAFT_53960 [Punctularia strigosozonata HHB-11173 SS5]|uniref:uncharacterized protein n=1 Tax=Punctularia strigosozonata (strain HHB-11173) TaxID=741275 RepID=UPI0004416F27|nr:uncharacterized protein PUNSTDRAFT_53960 [Punctularia strigosozonata HHB-11173 SS5]EIN06521.1 hypothetical protein PUNSTDRAFT_53960 [Punctularia strigosozonata HHB-11173 SS5]